MNIIIGLEEMSCARKGCQNETYRGSTLCRAHFAEWMRMPRKEQLLSKGARCPSCGRGFSSPRDATIDHIIPKSKGGKDGWYNKQLMHKVCNGLKGDRVSAAPKEEKTDD